MLHGIFSLVPVINVIPVITKTVGQSLVLECNVTTINDITDSVVILWSSDDIEPTRAVNNTNPITSNTTLYTGYYTIPQLRTTDSDRVYQCSVVINESPLPMIRTTRVIVNGKY